VFAASLVCGRAGVNFPAAAGGRNPIHRPWRTVHTSARSGDAAAQEHSVSEHSDDRTEAPDLLPVHPTVRARGGQPADLAQPAVAEAMDAVPPRVAAQPRIGGREILVVVAVLIVAFVDPFGAAALAIASVAVVIFRRSQASERYGFGDGFLPFKRELPWPRGVQEDDDFHFNWSGSSRAPG
jgi:hypothetical protein